MHCQSKSDSVAYIKASFNWEFLIIGNFLYLGIYYIVITSLRKINKFFIFISSFVKALNIQLLGIFSSDKARLIQCLRVGDLINVWMCAWLYFLHYPQLTLRYTLSTNTQLKLCFQVNAIQPRRMCFVGTITGGIGTVLFGYV